MPTVICKYNRAKVFIYKYGGIVTESDMKEVVKNLTDIPKKHPEISLDELERELKEDAGWQVLKGCYEKSLEIEKEFIVRLARMDNASFQLGCNPFRFKYENKSINSAKDVRKFWDFADNMARAREVLMPQYDKALKAHLSIKTQVVFLQQHPRKPTEVLTIDEITASINKHVHCKLYSRQYIWQRVKAIDGVEPIGKKGQAHLYPGDKVIPCLLNTLPRVSR